MIMEELIPMDANMARMFPVPMASVPVDITAQKKAVAPDSVARGSLVARVV